MNKPNLKTQLKTTINRNRLFSIRSFSIAILTTSLSSSIDTSENRILYADTHIQTGRKYMAWLKYNRVSWSKLRGTRIFIHSYISFGGRFFNAFYHLMWDEMRSKSALCGLHEEKNMHRYKTWLKRSTIIIYMQYMYVHIFHEHDKDSA